MSSNNQDTQSRILLEGKNEFLEKGFRDASLRNIARKAGVTTGAIYGYYTDKKALFDALVSGAATALKNDFISVQQKFSSLPTDRQATNMYDFTGEALQKFLDFVYENFDAFKLIICCSAGTEYESFVDSLVEIEMESTRRFLDDMHAGGYPLRTVSDNLIHILANAYFSAVFETVAHDMSKEEADKYMSNLTEFFNAGWDAILGYSQR